MVVMMVTAVINILRRIMICVCVKMDDGKYGDYDGADDERSWCDADANDCDDGDHDDGDGDGRMSPKWLS
eukprot:737863-Pyramimonas_sp.AAC.1